MEQMPHTDKHDPRITDLLDDPIAVALMRRDGVSSDHVHQLLNDMRKRLRERSRRLVS